MENAAQKKIIAFTTTVPVEVILAAEMVPMDLNNIFISAEKSDELVEQAEIFGFPRSSCAWIKGLFSVFLDKAFCERIAAFVAVTEGDCSNAKVLKEIIERQFKVPTYIFAYPYDRSEKKMQEQIEAFSVFLSTTLHQSEEIRERLAPLRAKLERLDELSWKYPGIVSGHDNHLWLVSASDFNGDFPKFNKDLDLFLMHTEDKIKHHRPPVRKLKKIAYLGVPPVFNLYPFLEKKGGAVVFNEIQREFAMLGKHRSLAEQYIEYTYPYSAEFRFNKAVAEIVKRKADCVIHYVQSFCHRQIEDIILRDVLKKNGVNIPVLTIEGDKPLKELDGRLKTRLEAFLETV